MFKDKTVLYIDDDSITRDTIQDTLKEKFKDVFIAKDGEEGFDMFLQLKPDLIISDIDMPKINGIELVKKIREVSQIQPIAMLTGKNEDKYILELLDLGISNFIVKPMNITRLDNILIDLIQNK